MIMINQTNTCKIVQLIFHKLSKFLKNISQVENQHQLKYMS